MSLINEALKKAQKQRTGESPSRGAMPGVGGESASRIASRAKPTGFTSLLVRIGIGAGAVALLVVVGIGLARYLTSQPAAPAPVKPAVVADVNVKPVGPEPAKPVKTTPATNFVLPVAPPPAKTEPTPVVSTPPPAESKPVVVAAPVPPPAPVKAAPPAKIEPKAITFIESLRVAGIRASATDSRDSKVLMNDRVYRTGDIVEHEMSIRLVEITSSSLTFEDERGARYTRSF